MARIRSIHPGMFTDEGYMALSLAAKACWPGIWTEADDAGVFEWKPLTLKAKLLPTENLDMEALLDEFLEHGLVVKFEIDGKAYGAVKNFGNWQRPKKPHDRYPLPHEYRIFVALKREHGVPLPHQFPTASESYKQRKEEGGRREEISEPNGSGAHAPKFDPVKAMFDDGVRLLTDTGSSESNARSQIGKWRKTHGDEATRDSIQAAFDHGITKPIEWINARLGKSKPAHETWDQRRIREGLEMLRQ